MRMRARRSEEFARSSGSTRVETGPRMTRGTEAPRALGRTSVQRGKNLAGCGRIVTGVVAIMLGVATPRGTNAQQASDFPPFEKSADEIRESADGSIATATRILARDRGCVGGRCCRREWNRNR